RRRAAVVRGVSASPHGSRADGAECDGRADRPSHHCQDRRSARTRSKRRRFSRRRRQANPRYCSLPLISAPPEPSQRSTLARLAAPIAAVVLLVTMVLMSRSFGATWDERALQKYGEQI